jgi:exodeoxyribonuclease V alpha subunit
LRYELTSSIVPETAVGRVIELVKTRIPKRFGFDPIRDIQVLCPMNRGGDRPSPISAGYAKLFPSSEFFWTALKITPWTTNTHCPIDRAHEGRAGDLVIADVVDLDATGVGVAQDHGRPCVVPIGCVMI